MPSLPAHRREVSCLALTFFYDYLEERGISRRRLQDGLPYSPEHLDSRVNWIDYGTFQAIERRMAELLPQPNLFYDIGLSFAATRGFGFLRVIFRSVASPYQLYTQLPRLVRRFLFPFVDIRMERTAPGHIQATYTFAERTPPTEAFLETVRGILTGTPLMMGLPPAKVTMVWPQTHRATFSIDLTSASRVGIPMLQSMKDRVVKTGRMWWHNLRDVAGELEETNRLLQEQVDALIQAKEQLDKRVRDLTVLNTVSRAATGALDLRRLLQDVVSALSEQLGKVPAAVLLAEGEPRRFVLAASAAFSRTLEDELTHERLAPLLESRAPMLVEAGHRTLRVLPVATSRTVVAALAVGDVGEEEDSLLGSVASQLAVAVENAISFQTIADLRDNLELRVRERTTELEEARGQLEDTVERLKRSDRARTEFFTNVSHELRTPLTLILAPLDTLEASLAHAPPETRANLRLIRDNAHTLLRLINEVLDFARIDAERMPLRPEPVALVQLVDDVVASLRPLAERKRVTLAWRAPEEPVGAQLDSKLLRRALVNLVANGIKFVDEGERVTVSLRTEGDEALLDVEDTGPGIPREYQQKVFERFQRVPDTRGRVIEGSGIGLAMVKEIVELHHGTIHLESEPGRGARFTVRLPRAGVEAAPRAPAPPLPDELPPALEPAPLAAPPPAPLALAPATSGRVLLVEDNTEMRAFLERLLSPHYRVTTAVDGEEGLRLAKEQLPDAVISDVMMPKIDGLDLCRRLKAERATHHIPVLLVSAGHGAEASLEGFQAGADDYVVKPFSAPELLARIEAQLRIRRLGLTVMRMEKQTTLGMLAAGIAHEVRNPVNAVLNAVPPLRRAVEQHQAEGDGLVGALLDSIERSGTRIRQVVDAMLALSREEPDRLRLRETRLGDGIDNTLAILQYRVSDGITIHREFEWNGTVWCYPDLVSQVVMNLVVNALDAVDPRRGNIWIRLRSDGEQVQLEVSDDGPGVPSELRERIFDPFFTTKPPGTGTGLGLAISREIASLHGGTLELVPRSGPGSTFVLTLPAEEPAHATGVPTLAIGATDGTA